MWECGVYLLVVVQLLLLFLLLRRWCLYPALAWGADSKWQPQSAKQTKVIIKQGIKSISIRAYLLSTNLQIVTAGHSSIRLLWQFVLNEGDALETIIASREGDFS